MEVFKVSSQNRVLILLTSRKVFAQDKVRCSALLSRSLTFLFPLEVLKLFSLILVRRLHPQFRVMSWVKVFSELLPVRKKVRTLAGRVSAELGGHVSSSSGSCWSRRALELIQAGGSAAVHGSPVASSKWSAIRVDGDANGTRLDSGTAGGWPLRTVIWRLLWVIGRGW